MVISDDVLEANLGFKLLHSHIFVALRPVALAFAVALRAALTILPSPSNRVPPGHGIKEDIFQAWKGMENSKGHGRSWKMMIISWNVYNCTEQFCKSDTTSFMKLNYVTNMPKRLKRPTGCRGLESLTASEGEQRRRAQK